jgi:hypothetical protein
VYGIRDRSASAQVRELHGAESRRPTTRCTTSRRPSGVWCMYPTTSPSPMPLCPVNGARVISSPDRMNGVMLVPFASTRIDRPLPSTSCASSTKAGVERSWSSTTLTYPLPEFSGRSIAIGSQSIATASQLKHKLKPQAAGRSFTTKTPRHEEGPGPGQTTDERR